MASALLQQLRLHPEPGSFANGPNGIKSNRDLDPVPFESDERKWTWPSLLGFWVAEAFSISMYQVASSSITKGLSPGLAILAVIVGHLLVCIPAMLNGYIGCIYGINFPVLMRSTFGIYGSKFAVFVRGVVACIWFGTQSFQGGQCVASMITAIWPSFKRFPNHIPASAHVTSAELLTFFLFIIIQLPLLWLHVSKLRFLFMAKTIIMPVFGMSLFIWALVAAKGFGPTFSKGTTIKDGTPVVVVFFQCVTTAIGPKATLALNMPDFTRYAKYPRQVFWTQAVGLCVLVTLCGILGITVTSAAQEVYGVLTWNPLQVSALWGNRAAQFFSSLCWAFAVIGTNISANSVSFSNDISLWFPSWINARRGAYICCVISVAATPWNIQYSAASFSAFLGGYSMFLGPIAGIMMADYWVLRKRHYNLSSFYRSPDIYTFFHGFNLRAFGAFTLAIAPNLAGLARATGQKSVPKGATYVYSLSWCIGTLVAFAAYYAFGKIWPMEDKFDESDVHVVEGEGSTRSYSDHEKGMTSSEKQTSF
ncbi:NCS1 nucleoside transporter [Amylocarpus encephaloides]|uniref:NCS1 nucleoside transporter n=1 Tax=Amylocarpus encephaloides TaxID=45428 RepID=A0A9P7YJN1_9HELO|nr:NCS1 nucleoside transporter [Amylocarpus encephaloides]